MRLCGISYKINNTNCLCGLQFHFNNGSESDAHECQESKNVKWQRVNIDPSDVIKTIETYVNTDNYNIQAIRLRDKFGVIMQNITTEKQKDKTKWVV